MSNFRLSRGADRFGPKKLIVVELGSDVTRFVTVARQGAELRWEKAKVLPPVDEELMIGKEPLVNFLKGEEHLNVGYVSVLMNTGGGFVRLLSFSGNPGSASVVTREVRQTLGVGDEFEVRHQVMRRNQSEGESESEEKSEYAVLAAAVPKDKSDALRKAVEDAGKTPVSLVPYGAATANLAETSIDLMTNDKAVGFLQIGRKNSMLVLYVAENLTLARHFKTGFYALLETVMKQYGLDEETAMKFVSSGSFEFSSQMSSAAKSWMHQVGISLDFIERRHGHRVDDLFILGPGDGVKALCTAFAGAVNRNVEPWEALQNLQVGEPPAELKDKQEFAACICEAQRIMQEGLTANA
ncbi:MAG: hypothetical protein R6V56_08430 [Lentisphaeria bacterium]